MANEVLYAGIADLTTAERLSAEYVLLAADRNALPNHPALIYAGDVARTGSNVLKIPEIGLMGYNLPSTVADGAEVANTTLTDGSATITVARKSKSYSSSDLARFIDAGGMLQADMMAQDAFASHVLALTETIAQLVGAFSNTAGASGSDLTVTNFLTAIGLLEVGYQGSIAPGEALCMLHTQQFADLRSSAGLSTAGAIQWQPATGDMLRIMGNGYRGRYFDVDLFASGHVPTANAGADRAGGIFVRGALAWADMGVVAETADQLAIGGKVLFERDRNGRAGLTDHVSHSYHGATEVIDAFGVSIITDA